MKYAAYIFMVLALLGFKTGVAQENPIADERSISWDWGTDSPPPDQPWIDDPDLSTITDIRLKELWYKIVVSYRSTTELPGRAANMYRKEEYISSVIHVEEQEYLITTLDRELHKEHVDWNCVYAILLMMEGGMNADSRICDLALYMFHMSRPIKLSDDRGTCYQHFMYVLRNQRSEEAATILRNAAMREFWGDDPMHSRKLHPRDTEESITQLRHTAVVSLTTGISPAISLPLLEELAQMYPLVLEEKQSKEDSIRPLIHDRLKVLKENGTGVSSRIQEKKQDLP